MPVDPQRVQAVFLAAVEAGNVTARAAVLDRECGADSELRQRVEALLKAHDEPDSFLDEQAADLSPTTDTTSSPGDSAEQSAGERASVATERIGSHIGPYKLLEQIGEGGFGVVFMAEQTQPIRRKVALKILKPGMDTRQVIARFEAERQALALMDHPHIAHVFDGGETPTGRPYFVMELVKGVPITDFCDHNHMPIRERLGLFVHVCQAVQHAHQKGIIHRDLKPSNVLVTLHDGTPAPKVIDFGIAKATGQQLTEKTLFTNFAQMIGTPLYMSPEQAGMSGLDVDTRSDIYSLGVLLYELLTGTTPFDKEQLKALGFDELRRIIREEEPPRPSTRLSTLGQASTPIATRRQSDPKRLSQLFRGELDWIVMKSLEKDRSRRYETAGAFAADVQRYLHDEPVQACPPSRWYRLRKFARRNRVALTTAGIVALALILGTLVSTWQAFRAKEAEGLAEDRLEKEKSERERADNAVGKAQQTAKLLELEKRQAKRSLSTFLLDKGLDLCEKGEVGLGLLWLARSLESAPAEAADLQRAIRRNLAAWPNQTGVLHTVLHPQGHVQRVAFRADGKTLLTVSNLGANAGVYRGEVRRWDRDTGEPIGSPIPHKGHAQFVGISPDGRMVLTQRDPKTAQLWDLDTGQPQGAPLPLSHGLQRSDDTVLFSGDGRIVLIADGDTVRLWETAGGKPLGKPINRGGWTSVAALSPDGQTVLTASQNNLPQLWRAGTGEPLASLLPHPGNVIAAAFTSDSKRVLTVGQQIRIWEAASGKPLNKDVARGPTAVRGWVFGPDPFVLGYFGKEVHVWMLGPRPPWLSRGDLTLSHSDPVNAAAFSPDGFLIATASGQTARLWTNGGASLGAPLQHPLNVTNLAFSPDGRSLLTCCGDGTARLWDLPLLPRHDVWPLSDMAFCDFMALSADGKILLRQLGSLSEGFTQVWDVARRKPISPIVLTGLPSSAGAAVSADGRKALLCRGVYTRQSITDKHPAGFMENVPAVLWLWQAGKWEQIACPRELTETVRPFMAFGPDGKAILVGSPNRGAQLWDVESWKPLGPVLDHGAALAALAIGPDGRTAVTTGGRSAQLWDARTGKRIGPRLLHQGDIRAVAFSPRGGKIATTSADKTVRLWNVGTGKLFDLPLTHPQEVRAVAFSPDGATLLTACADGKVRFWDTGTGRSLGPPSYADNVKTLAFSRDDKSVLIATPSALRRWEVPQTPTEGDAERLRLWAEVMTGRNLDQTDVAGWLSAEDWSNRRQRLLAGGVPPVPSADQRAWNRYWAEALENADVTAALWHLERLIEVEPRQWQHYLARGKLRGWAPEAVADYSRAIALGAEGHEVWERRGSIYTLRKQWDKAADDFRQAAQRGADDTMRCRHVLALWMAGKTDAYRRACDDLLARLGQTDDAALASDVASMCLLDRQPPVDLRLVVRLAEKGLAVPFEGPSGQEVGIGLASEVRNEESERRETLALALYRASRFEDAIRCLNERPKYPPRSPFDREPTQNHLCLLAMAHERLGQHDKANEWLIQAVAAHASGAPSLRQEAEDSIGLHPSVAEGHYRLGLSFEKKGQWDQAIREFRAAIGLKPDYAKARDAHGRAEIGKYRAAVALNRNDANAHFNLGVALRNKRQWDEAIAEFQAAIRLEPKALFSNTLGGALYQQGKPNEAIACYRKAIESNPNDAPLHNDLAWLLATCPQATFRDPNSAVELAERAVELKPEEYGYWHTLGVAYYRAKKWEKALSALEKSCRLEKATDGKGNAWQWVFQAMAHWQLGHKDEALLWYNKTVQLEKVWPEELRRFRAEAAELLGIGEKKN
ncbi:MAG TPA: tetratricopeptide repeat protein [Gemmataceae bacterium]